MTRFQSISGRVLRQIRGQGGGRRVAREAPFSICDSRRGRCRLGGQVSWKLANISSLYLRLPGPPPSRKEISSKAVFPDGPFPPVGGNTGQGAGKALEA